MIKIYKYLDFLQHYNEDNKPSVVLMPAGDYGRLDYVRGLVGPDVSVVDTPAVCHGYVITQVADEEKISGLGTIFGRLFD